MHTLICRECHAVVEFDDCNLTMLEKLLTVQTGFTIQGHRLELYGICPTCRQEPGDACTHPA
jgi:Fe2+ or Zn2+ uptake regulation protein